MDRVPDIIVHYARGEPFLSITSEPPEKRAAIIQGLNEMNAWGLDRFRDLEYLERRSRVELRIREEFISRGGRPELRNPIYFFLGRHKRFEMKNRGYPVRLADISPDQISFTYGDSLLAYDEKYREIAGAGYRSALCARLYRIEELGALAGDLPEENALAMEAQLWINPPASN